MTAVEIKSFDEQVFQYRNKAYGAYRLRKNQNRNLLIGMIAVYGLAALIWGTCQAVASFFPDKPHERITDGFFPDPEVTPEAEPKIEKPKPIRAKKLQNLTTNPHNSFFQISNNLVTDSINEETSPTTEIGTEAIDGSEDETGNSMGNEKGKGTSSEGIIGEEETEAPPIQVIEPAAFPGGDQMMEKYIKTNFQFPEKESTGTLVVYYEIDEHGKTRNVKILKSFPGASPFELEAIRVISNMPDWSPQKVNGKPVTVRKEIKINCKL